MAIGFSLGQQWSPLDAESVSGMPSFADALHKGIMSIGQEAESKNTPKRLAEEMLAKQLQNRITKAKADYAPQNEALGLQLKQGEVGMIPYRQKLLEAQAQRQGQLASQPFGGQLTGSAKEAYALEMMKQQLGEDNPAYQNAKRSYDLALESQQGLNDYRKSLMGTANKRASTQLGKLDQEQQEVEQGFMPGTNGQVQLSPQQQDEMMGQYQLQRQKITSDVDTRKKNLFATNIDKTLDNINVKDLTQFGGLAGGIVKKMNEGRALTGNESESYRRYHDSLTAAKLLAKQVRQFYGDSITPGVQEQLSMLTNPSSWTNNPEIATRKFNQFKKILKQETETYRDATKSTKVFKDGSGSSNSDLTYNLDTGEFE